MVCQPTFLGETFPAHVTSIGSLARVDAHVSDERIVNRKLTLTDLTTVGFLVGVRAVVKRKLGRGTV